MFKENKNSNILINVDQMSFYRGDRRIYENINLNIIKGKITAIIGPSGTGKTTLLRLIGGQLKPCTGTITYDGIDINSLSRTKLYELRKKMSMLFQSGALFTDMNVYENVAYPIKEHTKLPEELIETLVKMKLETVGLRGALKLMPSQLSGGMARRVAIARAIALDPEVIMYDEPFTGQDPITMAILIKLIKELNQTLGITSIIVSHDVAEVMSIADYVYLISEGKILAKGTPKEINENKDPIVDQFVHGIADGSIPFQYPSKYKYIEDLQ